MDTDKLYSIRDATNADKKFITKTFLNAVRFGNDFFREIYSDSFFSNYKEVVDKLMSHSSNDVKVACLAEDPDVILGYSIHSKDGKKAHFVFVKSAWRSLGIARSLVPPTVKVVTHITKPGLSIIRKRGIEFDPFNLP